MDDSASSPSVSQIKPTFACARCSERKVRCDRQDPCHACTKHNVQCIYRPPQPTRRRRRLAREENLDERLKIYEALLRDKGVDPKQISVKPNPEPNQKSLDNPEVPATVWQLPSPVSIASGPQATIFTPQVLQGQGGTKLVDNSLWSRVAEEIHDIDLNASYQDLGEYASDSESSDDDHAYVLGGRSPSAVSSHPPSEVVRRLWQTFVERVDPLHKIVHVPSLRPAIEKATSNIEHVPKGFEALMFAIYSIAVMSLTEDECQETMGEHRAFLLPRYVGATKAALSRARFMSSTSIVVFQALVLHIISIRDTYEPRALWSLTGLALRIAQNMGMRVDGALLGLSPFETEMHRRIWWQLRLHDFRTAELSGQAKFRDFEIDETTPKIPANVDDRELFPTMSKPPVESKKLTDIIWVMLRCDLATFAASQKVKMQKKGEAMFTSEEYMAMDNLKVKDDFIKKIEDMVETKYLRFCDPSEPLQFLTLVCARVATNVIRFVAHHPRRWAHMDHVPESEKNFVWNTVVQMLDHYRIIQSNPQLRLFAWNAPFFIQWHAVIHILDTLRADPLRQDAAKAWNLIDALYENNTEMLLSTNRPVFVAVGNLCLKAFDARTTALNDVDQAFIDPPEYVTKLRQQREAAKAKRASVAVSKREQQNADLPKTSTMTTPTTSSISPDTYGTLVNTPLEAQQQQQQYVPMNDPVQGGITAGDDAFWLNETLNDDFLGGGATDMMNLDTDAILAQGSWLNNPSGEMIDWEQWDAFLGNTDPKRTNISTGPR